MNNIYLIGFMGCGKSAVARELGIILSVRVLEMDEKIEEHEGMSIPDIFAKKKEDGFREIETGVLRLVAKKDNQVISCGGGVVLRDENINIMKNSGVIIRLTADPETVFERVKRNDNRPLVKNISSADEIKKMMDVREDRYIKAADYTIDCGSSVPVREAAEHIVKLIQK